MTVKYYIEAI